MNLLGQAGSLDRHQQWRKAGVPTISVLCGSTGLALEAGRGWAEQGKNPVIQLGTPLFEEMLEAWVDGLAAGPDLVGEAIAWLARHSGRAAADSDSLEARVAQLRTMSPIERTLVFESMLNGVVNPCAVAVCRGILEPWSRGKPIPGSGLLGRLIAEFGECNVDGYAGTRDRVFGALCEIVPAAHAPVLLLVREPSDKRTERSTWVVEAVSSLARFAEGHPALVAILAIEAADLDRYLRDAPESRAKALVRAGVIAVRGLNEGEMARRLASELPEPKTLARFEGTLHRLASDGVSDELFHHFLDAARASGRDSAPPETEGTDLARSAAERFLFERLASLPATAGLFELNASLDFRFGPTRAMEVDLWARTLGLAVEVDGYYHFQDADAYRRDRRKDVELQKRGYLVVRVLAEDVVARLEDVLSIILEAVASRGGRNPSQL